MNYMSQIIVQKLISNDKSAKLIIIQLTTRLMILLEWLLHLLNIPQQPTQIKEEDVSSLIRRLLLKIDAEHFRQLSDQLWYGYTQDEEFLQIFTHIASYLNIKEYKKFNCQFQKETLANRNTSQLLGLVLYLAVNSDIKKEAIQSILEFEEEQQLAIMKTIQNIESKCEQVAELKKIVEKIENIQQENEILREKIMLNEEQYNHQINQIQQIQSWNAIFSKQNAEYQEQKLSIFKELDISGIKQFTEICHLSRRQNEELNTNLQLLLDEKGTLNKQNAKLKKQLKHCGETIQKQILDIEDLKSKCKLLNQQYWLSDNRFNGQMPDIPILPLKDNQNILNLDGIIDQEKTKVPTDRTQCSNQHEDLEQSFEMKNNLHVLLSLQDLERQHQEKINQIERLKQQKIYELAKQCKLDKKVKKIKECHQFFFSIYQNIKIIKA